MLTAIADGIWEFRDDLRLPMGCRLPSRTTILRREDGGLVVHSPLDFDDATTEAIDVLGPVRAIVAPNCVHYLHLGAAARRWPGAVVFGPSGLARKTDVPFVELPASGTVPSLGSALAVRKIEGVPAMAEHAILHLPTRSLVVTDLVFNVHACADWKMRVFLRCVGAHRKLAQSRFWWFLTRDRRAAQASVEALLHDDFTRLVMAHGDVVEDDAKSRLRLALSWIVRPTAA